MTSTSFPATNNKRYLPNTNTTNEINKPSNKEIPKAFDTTLHSSLSSPEASAFASKLVVVIAKKYVKYTLQSMRVVPDPNAANWDIEDVD